MRAGKKTRRMISLVLSLALILTMYIPVHAETPADPLHMTASSDSLEVGGTVTVTLTLDEFDTKNMTGGIAWDSGLMTLTAYSGSRGTATVYVQQYSRDFEEWDRVNARTSTIEEAGVTGTFGFYVNADGTTVEKLRQDPDGERFLALSLVITAEASEYPIYMYQSSDTEDGVINYDPINDSEVRTSENYRVLVPQFGITVNGGTADKETAKEGETVTVTWTSKTNYQFTGWTSDTEGVEFEDASAESTSFAMPASDVTVTAQSKKKTSGGGGSGGGSSSGSGSSGSSSEPEQKPEEKEKFTDVPKDAYYHDPVYWAVEKGITEGTSPTTFSPMAPTTRADFVTFLWRAAGSPKVSGEMPFEDVSESAYYYDAVLWAYVNGITEGTTPTTFRPDRTVTRGQAVTFLHRNAGEPGVGDTNPFTDVEESDYYYAPILWAVEKKIVEGTTPTTFSPNRDSYRAEVVTMLYRELAK